MTSTPNATPGGDAAGPPPRWPIFICYRRVDGGAAARRLYEALDQWQTAGPDGRTIQIDAYLDETVPGVADWQKVHRPYLEKARALIVVCSPGAKLYEGRADWVHREIGWWLEHRDVAPILIDPLMEGLRYVPDAIGRRWPEIQRIPLLERDWSSLSGVALEEKVAALRRQVLGAILPSGAEVYAQELEVERLRAGRLRWALALALVLFLVSAAAAVFAFVSRETAARNERAARAALLDAQAADAFSESRRIEAHRDVDRARLRELEEKLSALEEGGKRLDNVGHEATQLLADLRQAKDDGRNARRRGVERLREADAAWSALAAEGRDPAALSRTPAQAPHVFSVEVMNAGRGESILLHYGPPDELRLVMINAGPAARYAEFVVPRLRELAKQRFDDGPVPLELFIAGDRDEAKTGGLLRMLEQLSETTAPEKRALEFHGIWFNVFRVNGERLSLRPRIRQLIDALGLPHNRPFDHLVMRPDGGCVVVPLSGGLEVTVLGPTLERVRNLYDWERRGGEVRDGRAIEPFPDETFSKVRVASGEPAWAAPSQQGAVDGTCRPSDNALANAKGSYSDKSVVNLASIVVVFRYRGKTFLFSGDARGDLIIDGLTAAGLLEDDRTVQFDLMSIPHLGSDRNVTLEFFQRVQARNYLFSGDGTHGNPEVSTVASLIAARGCDRYRMWFVNREDTEGADGEGGARFDDFFAAEDAFAPSYRRIFRSEAQGSMIVDLLDPLNE